LKGASLKGDSIKQYFFSPLGKKAARTTACDESLHKGVLKGPHPGRKQGEGKDSIKKSTRSSNEEKKKGPAERLKKRFT